MKIIAVVSGKGGTGKSCVAAYTGAALAKAGRKTLLLELGANFKALDLIVGMPEQSVYDISDVFAGRCPPEDAITRTDYHRNLFLLPAGINPPDSVPYAGIDRLVERLKKKYDYIVVDGIDFSLYTPKPFDVILQVLTPDSLCIRACAQQARWLLQEGAGNLRMIINSVPPRVLPMYGIRDFDDIIDTVGVQLMAVIPESPKLRYSSNNAKILDEESLTNKVFDSLAQRIEGKRAPLLVR